MEREGHPLVMHAPSGSLLGVFGDGRRTDLAVRLNALYATYDIRFLDPDPLLIVREFTDSRDQEVAGFFAAAFAYGGVRTIMRDVRELFRRMDGEPYAFTAQFVPKRDDKAFSGWYHRLHRGEDAASLVWALRRALDEYGTLGAAFASKFDPSSPDIASALHAFVSRLRAYDPAPIRPGPFFRHLLTSPEDGSACKRMNLYLRWMVRRTSPDLGVWRGVPSSHLVVPFDTHVARISRAIGLTRRATPNWLMAREITDALKAIDPDDPVKFDYALCRLGILDLCPRRRDPVKCSACLIQEICTL